MTTRRPEMIALIFFLVGAPGAALSGEIEQTVYVPKGWEGAYDFGYAPVVRVCDIVIVSGVPAAGPGSYEDTSRWIYQPVQELLEEAGATTDDVVELTTFHAEPKDSEEYRVGFKHFMPVHRELSGEHRPPWNAVGTSVLLPTAPIEMRVVAPFGPGNSTQVVGASAGQAPTPAEPD